MTSVLITGASGFIGRSLIYELEKQDLSIIAPKSAHGRVEDEQFWSALPRADQVIHLAAKSVIPDSWKNPLSQLQVNVIGTAHAAQYCQRNNSRLIVLSSFIYDTKTDAPFVETDSLAPHNPYGLSKLLAEQLAMSFSDFWSIPLVTLRVANVFGPGQSSEFLIPSIINQVCNNKSIEIRDGTPRRDFLFIKDLVEVLVRLINQKTINGVFNVGSGTSHSVQRVVDIAQELAGTTLPVVCRNEVRENEILDSQVDISKLSNALLWQPQWSLKTGLQILLDECQRN